MHALSESDSGLMDILCLLSMHVLKHINYGHLLI